MQPDNSNTTEIKVSPSRQLHCSTSERQLAIATTQGLKLYCRSCGYAHLFTWQQLEQLANELSGHE